MDSREYHLWVTFKLKLLQSNGASFQQLFEVIMRERHGHEFIPVRPWQGDGGNDGFLKLTNHYFQVYGPMASTELNPVVASKKAAKDFQTLKANWPNLEAYSFVMNDRFDNVPAPVLQALHDIESNHSILSTPVSAATLESWFLDLDLSAKMRVMQAPPVAIDEHMILPEYVRELLEHIENSMDPMQSLLSTHNLPGFQQKIDFNQLSERPASALRDGVLYMCEVDCFLESRPGLSQSISQKLNNWYLESVESIQGQDSSTSDLRFIFILRKMLPDNFDELPPVQRLARQQTAITVMSKYFETCDIYENPIST